jgi:hypothetical protein
LNAPRDRLVQMLTYRRPAGSNSELHFINRYIKPLKPEIDSFGNLIVRVGTSKVLWSSHTDTVHEKGGRQEVHHDGSYAKFFTFDKESNCLGADCTTGVWLMIEMIHAKVPGVYVFHRAEEIGCQGSKFIAKHTPELLAGIEFAIAFDRMKTGSIITFQNGTRCCSEEFATSLGGAIGLGMKSDDTGMFTDTASYTALIGECTNISVGYYEQHGWNEWQDVPFVLSLREKMLAFDESKLVSKRKPGDYESKWKNWGYYGSSWQDDMYYYGDDKDLREMTRLIRQNASLLARALKDEGVEVSTIENLIERGQELVDEAPLFLDDAA